MNFHTFGNKSNKVVMLIHGMLTPWQIWEDAAEYFSKEYYVVIPELDGHTEQNSSEFVSVEKEAEKLAEYIRKNFDGKIYALCGLSMGGRIAAYLAGTSDIFFDYLVIDGAPLKKMPKLLTGIMKKNYISIIEESKKRNPKIIESCKKDFLPERYLNDFFKIADNISTQSISNIIDSVFGEFEYKKYDDKAKILFMHGTKGNESVARKSAAAMKKINPQTEIRCFKGYAHAQLACFEIEKWIDEVSKFIT